jgi:lipopolysaccharide/colanic/teichoic acid biosynthesis glycosyltransferase
MLVAICLRATLESPVLFRQRRLGLDGRLFTLEQSRAFSHAKESISRDARVCRSLRDRRKPIGHGNNQVRLLAAHASPERLRERMEENAAMTKR